MYGRSPCCAIYPIFVCQAAPWDEAPRAGSAFRGREGADSALFAQQIIETPFSAAGGGDE
jgi:hypothetical protein